nr:hypothetical protein GCM10020093_087640 [Planobispora longispora]
MAENTPLRIHHLRPAPGANKSKVRKGRGEASKGKTAGRGTKGTTSRNKVPLGFEGGQVPLQRRLPKMKGFSNAPSRRPTRSSTWTSSASCSPRVATSPSRRWSPRARSARTSW